MANLSSKWKWVLFSAVFLLLVVSTIGVGVYSARKRQEEKSLRKEWLTAVPPLKSNVKDLEIINPIIVRQGTELSGVAFQVSNKSGRPVMAVRIGSGNAFISKDGLEDEENPQVIIQPYGVLDADMTELTKGAPLLILSATFQDATGYKEEGDKRSLELTQKLRERAKKGKAEKENLSPNWKPNP